MTAQRIGRVVFLAGWSGIITSIALSSLALFIAATVIAGTGQGIAISSATRGLLYAGTLADRAPIFGAFPGREPAEGRHGGPPQP
ncbi:hypothetical protein [Actinacidiphila glaucinigra]|uniref:hypothetical protein n=1 Tax=Actinacidiphila glaucinigra TaxID=235986 RepID=UPI002E301B9E|nr:hypothetical protein [Actinacidiphila glaucinigra]